MTLDKIYAGVRRFQEQEFPSRRGLFEGLGAGQQPTLLLVTCSDSRIDPALLTQTDPGEIFVVRNAGNIVPPAGGAPGGEMATIEYGIDALRIPHIVVCGHTHCGAMAALRDPKAAEGLSAVPHWIEHGRPALDREARLGDGRDALSNTVAANVLTQLDNLRTYPFVARALERGELELHAWVYDFVSGDLHVADERGVFEPLRAGSSAHAGVEISA